MVYAKNISEKDNGYCKSQISLSEIKQVFSVSFLISHTCALLLMGFFLVLNLHANVDCFFNTTKEYSTITSSYVYDRNLFIEHFSIPKPDFNTRNDYNTSAYTLNKLRYSQEVLNFEVFVDYRAMNCLIFNISNKFTGYSLNILEDTFLQLKRNIYILATSALCVSLLYYVMSFSNQDISMKLNNIIPCYRMKYVSKVRKRYVKTHHFFLPIWLFNCKMFVIYFLVANVLKEKRFESTSLFNGLDYCSINAMSSENQYNQNLILYHLYIWRPLGIKKIRSFLRLALLLSGDVSLNPGPTGNECICCHRAVDKRGLSCTNCGIRLHKKCNIPNIFENNL